MIELGFDLKAPCNDCPFRKSVPCHQGVAGGLPDYAKSIIKGNFSHSCHKTDARAQENGNAKLIKEKVQHCVGAILSCEKSGMGQMPYLTAWVNKKFKIQNLTGADDVMTIPEMLEKYLDFMISFPAEP